MTSGGDVGDDAANGIAMGVPSGVQYHDEETTVQVKVDVYANDWSVVEAGSVTVAIFYLL